MRTQIVTALAVVLSAAVSSAALADGIGVVESIEQSAYGTQPNAAKMEISQGDAVMHRELLETSTQGSLMARFVDGSQLMLGAGSKALVVAYSYKPQDSLGNAVISLPAGSMHYVTGAMPKGHTTIYTPVAAMTLNGTDISVGVNPQGITHLSVAEGSVTVHSRSTGQDTVFKAGQSVDITRDGFTQSTADAATVSPTPAM